MWGARSGVPVAGVCTCTLFSFAWNTRFAWAIAARNSLAGCRTGWRATGLAGRARFQTTRDHSCRHLTRLAQTSGLTYARVRSCGVARARGVSARWHACLGRRPRERGLRGARERTTAPLALFHQNMGVHQNMSKLVCHVDLVCSAMMV